VFKDTWRESTGKTIFIPTEKDVELDRINREEGAYWIFAKQLDDKLGSTGGTLNEIYYKIGRPLGLSLDTTRILLKGALASGYITKGGYIDEEIDEE